VEQGDVPAMTRGRIHKLDPYSVGSLLHKKDPYNIGTSVQKSLFSATHGTLDELDDSESIT